MRQYLYTTRAKPSTLNLILNATPSRNLENGPKQRRRKQRQKENPFGSHDKTKEEIIAMAVLWLALIAHLGKDD